MLTSWGEIIEAKVPLPTPGAPRKTNLLSCAIKKVRNGRPAIQLAQIPLLTMRAALGLLRRPCSAAKLRTRCLPAAGQSRMSTLEGIKY
jgi:hypothetical protein